MSHAITIQMLSNVTCNNNTNVKHALNNNYFVNEYSFFIEHPGL